MAFLTPDKTTKITVGGKTLTVSKKIIPDNLRATRNLCSWVRKGGLMKPCAKVSGGSGKPRGITVHNTGAIRAASGTTMAEQYTRATYNQNMSGVIVHYYVSGYDAIWQMLSTEPGKVERGWHAADGSSRRRGHTGKLIGGNLDTIAIECIGNSAEAEDATALLVAYLCQLHGLDPATDVYTHNYFMYGVDKAKIGARKNCPIYILPHWNEFLNKVKCYYGGNINGEAVNPVFKPYMVRVVCKELNIRKTPKWGDKDVVGTIRNGGAYTIVGETMLGSTKFGLLKSGEKYRDRWISLGSAYVKRI